MEEWPREGWVIHPRFRHDETNTLFAIPYEVYAETEKAAKTTAFICAVEMLKLHGYNVNGYE